MGRIFRTPGTRKRVKVQLRVVAPLEDELELAVNVRGLVLTVGVGLQRVPLPYSLLLDGVDLRGKRVDGVERPYTSDKKLKAKNGRRTKTGRLSSPMKSADDTVSTSSQVTSRIGPLMPKSIGFSSSE